jgi:hypothetical protein
VSLRRVADRSQCEPVGLSPRDRSSDPNEQHRANLASRDPSGVCTHLSFNAGSPPAVLCQGGGERETEMRPCPGLQTLSRAVVTSLLRSLRLLARHHPAVQSAPRAGTVADQLIHGTRHRCGTDRLERGSQPGPDGPRPARHAGQTYNAGPRSSGDRASVSKRASAVPSPPPSTAFPLLSGKFTVLMSIFDVPLSPAKSSHLQRSADHTRTSSVGADRSAVRRHGSWGRPLAAFPLPTPLRRSQRELTSSVNDHGARSGA